MEYGISHTTFTHDNMTEFEILNGESIKIPKESNFNLTFNVHNAKYEGEIDDNNNCILELELIGA